MEVIGSIYTGVTVDFQRGVYPSDCKVCKS